jgi:hypothetical protein
MSSSPLAPLSPPPQPSPSPRTKPSRNSKKSSAHDCILVRQIQGSRLHQNQGRLFQLQECFDQGSLLPQKQGWPWHKIRGCCAQRPATVQYQKFFTPRDPSTNTTRGVTTPSPFLMRTKSQTNPAPPPMQRPLGNSNSKQPSYLMTHLSKKCSTIHNKRHEQSMTCTHSVGQPRQLTQPSVRALQFFHGASAPRPSPQQSFQNASQPKTPPYRQAQHTSNLITASVMITAILVQIPRPSHVTPSVSCLIAARRILLFRHSTT